MLPCLIYTTLLNLLLKIIPSKVNSAQRVSCLGRGLHSLIVSCFHLRGQKIAETLLITSFLRFLQISPDSQTFLILFTMLDKKIFPFVLLKHSLKQHLQKAHFIVCFTICCGQFNFFLL